MTDVRSQPSRHEAALTALGGVLQAVARSNFELRDVLQIVIEEAVRLSGADSGNVAIRDGEIGGSRERRTAGGSRDAEASTRPGRLAARDAPAP